MMKNLYTSESELIKNIDKSQMIVGFCTDLQKKSPTSTFKSYLLIAEQIESKGYHTNFIFLGIDINTFTDIKDMLKETQLKDYSILSLPDNEKLDLKELTGLKLIFTTEHFNRHQHQLPEGIKIATSVHSRNHSCTYKHGLLYYFFNNFEQFNNRIKHYPKGMFDYHFIDNRAHQEELGYIQGLFQAVTGNYESSNTWVEKMCYGYIRGDAYNVNKGGESNRVILFAPVNTSLRQDWFSEEKMVKLLCENFPDYEVWYRVALSCRDDDYHKVIFKNLSEANIANLVFDERSQSDNIAEVYANSTILVTDASEAALSFTISQVRPTLHCTKGRVRVPGSVLTDNYDDAIIKIREILSDIEGIGRTQYEELIKETRPLGETVEYISNNIDGLVSGSKIPDCIEYISQEPIMDIDYNDNEMIDRYINFCIENGASEGGIDQKYYDKCLCIKQSYPADHKYNKWFMRSLESPLFSWMQNSPQHSLYYKVFYIRGSIWAGDIQKAQRVFAELLQLDSKTAISPSWLGGRWNTEELKHFIPVLLSESNKWKLPEYQRLCQSLLSIISQAADSAQIPALFTALTEVVIKK